MTSTPPSSLPDFAELGVSRAVVQALAARQIATPFPIQAKVIADTLAGRDVLARSPTGSGKTLAFGIPLIDRVAAESARPAALVLAPTRELASQIVEELRPLAHARALKITAVYGGVGLVKQGQDAAGSHIVVATPGRLEDHLQRGAFTLDHVQILVLDEADRMLDMGFRPAVDRITAQCRRPGRQTLCFSATLDGAAGQVARALTRDAVTHEHGPSDRRTNVAIEHRFREVVHEDRVEALVDELAAPDRELTLVFVRTKRGADRLAKRLGDHGVAAAAMHGNKSQRQRERALAQFEAWEIDTLVATDVAARGIDVNGISHVINFDPPDDSETYVHRAGRTARAGASGVAITLVAADQRREVARMADDLGVAHDLVPSGAGRSASAPAGHARGRGPAQDRGAKPSRGDGRPAGQSRQSESGRGGGRGSGQGRGSDSGRGGASGAPRGGGSTGRPKGHGTASPSATVKGKGAHGRTAHATGSADSTSTAASRRRRARANQSATPRNGHSNAGR